MDVRLTVSLLDADGLVVAWGFVRAATRGDGGLWALEPLVTTVEREVPVAERVVHWADLHVGQRVPFELEAHRVGVGLQILFPDPLLQFQVPAWDVPCVTVRGDALVAPGAGRLGAK